MGNAWRRANLCRHEKIKHHHSSRLAGRFASVNFPPGRYLRAIIHITIIHISSSGGNLAQPWLSVVVLRTHPSLRSTDFLRATAFSFQAMAAQ